MAEEVVEKDKGSEQTDSITIVRSAFTKLNCLGEQDLGTLRRMGEDVRVVNLAQRNYSYADLIGKTVCLNQKDFTFEPLFVAKFGQVLAAAGLENVEGWIKAIKAVDFEELNRQITEDDFSGPGVGLVLKSVYEEADRAYHRLVFKPEYVFSGETVDKQKQAVSAIGQMLEDYVFPCCRETIMDDRVDNFGLVRFDPRSKYADAYGLAFKVIGYEKHIGLPLDFGLNVGERGGDVNIASHELTHYLGHMGELPESLQLWFATAIGQYLEHSFPFTYGPKHEITPAGSLPVLNKSSLVSEGLISSAVNETGQAFFLEMSRIVNNVGLSTGILESPVAIRVGTLSAVFAVRLSQYYGDWQVGLAFMVALARPAGSFVYAEAVANRFAELKKENIQPTYLFREEHRDWSADLLNYRYILYAAEESCQKLRF